MNDNRCKSCLFWQICPSDHGCDNYTPSGDDAEEAELNTYIEEQRLEFRDAWWSYTSGDFE